MLFLPSRVVATPRAPPKRAVLVGAAGRAGAVVKADAEAAKPNKINDCFMVVSSISGYYWHGYQSKQ